MSQDSHPGRQLGPYACFATFLQLFVIGQGIVTAKNITPLALTLAENVLTFA